MSDERTASDGFECVRCGGPEREPLPRPPFPDALGARLQAEICTDCWEEWKRRQMLLINHYGLSVRDARAREFLVTNLRSFLFGEGENAEIDTSREGDVSW